MGLTPQPLSPQNVASTDEVPDYGSLVEAPRKVERTARLALGCAGFLQNLPAFVLHRPPVPESPQAKAVFYP